MTISKELLDIILILTPGIIAFYIIEALTHHKKIEYKRVLLNVIILNFIIYFLIYLLSIGVNKHSPDIAHTLNLTKEHILSKDTNITTMALGLFFSILIGLTMARAVNEKYLFKIAKYLKASDLDSNLNVWDDFLSEERSFPGIIVRDKQNNLMYYGIPKRYSEFSLDKKELHLMDVRIYFNDDTENELYRQDELYLVLNDTMTMEIPNLNTKE